MKAFKINPTLRAISEITLEARDDDGASHIQEIIEGHFEILTLEEGVYLFVNDEGLRQPNKCFMFLGLPFPVAGIGVISAINEEGETIDCPWKIEDIEDRIAWTNLITKEKK